MNLAEWWPSQTEIISDLSFVPPVEFDSTLITDGWNGYKLHYLNKEIVDTFHGHDWSRWTSLNWHLPLIVVAGYIAMVTMLPIFVKERIHWRWVNVIWNFALSAYSFAGVLFTVPILFTELSTNGLYFATCAPAPWYGFGYHGLFVALFVYSKFFELVDTFLLIVGKRPVMMLQWWHHATVLLYCWHSYTTQIGTGVWFATMNYCVHSVMYFYFGATQTGPTLRKIVRPFAIYITLIQLLQMVVGIFITVRAVMFQLEGKDCNVNKTNSILGLAMYASYLILFSKLFVDNYILKKKDSVVSNGSKKSA